MEHAKRFRVLLADLGLTHPEAAKLLHVSLRTLQNWLSGRHQVPYAVYKLLRLSRYMELPGKSWEGWHFSRGMLVTPEGRHITGKDGSWWSLLVRQAACFRTLYDRSNQFEKALMELAKKAGSVQSGAAGVPTAAAKGTPRRHRSGGGGQPLPAQLAGAAQPPAALSSLKNTSRHKPSFTAGRGDYAITSIAVVSPYGIKGVAQ